MLVYAWNCMETDVIDSKMVMHVIKSEIRNGHVMHVIYVIFFITCVTHSYFALHALHTITWYLQRRICNGPGSTYNILRANSCSCLQKRRRWPRQALPLHTFPHVLQQQPIGWPTAELPRTRFLSSPDRIHMHLDSLDTSGTRSHHQAQNPSEPCDLEMLLLGTWHAIGPLHRCTRLALRVLQHIPCQLGVMGLFGEHDVGEAEPDALQACLGSLCTLKLYSM